MNLSALVLHNVSPDMFFRFDSETSTLHHAHEFQIVADSPENAADLVWVLANVGDGDELRVMYPRFSLYASQVDEYRKRMNRSLSVGDVVVLHEIGENERLAGVLVVKSLGFESLDSIPEFAVGSNESEVSTSYGAHTKFTRQFNRQ